MNYTINMSPKEVLERLIYDAFLDDYAESVVRRSIDPDQCDEFEEQVETLTDTKNETHEALEDLMTNIRDNKGYRASRLVKEELEKLIEKLKGD